MKKVGGDVEQVHGVGLWCGCVVRGGTGGAGPGRAKGGGETWTWSSLPPARDLESKAPCDLGLQRREVLLSILRPMGNHPKPLKWESDMKFLWLLFAGGTVGHRRAGRPVRRPFARAQASEGGGLGG